MPSEITRPLYEGEPISFPEFAARTARWVGPWNGYERDVALDAPLPDGFESSSGAVYEKDFRENAAELAKVVAWSPEEADSHAHQHNLFMLKSHLQIVRASRTKARSYQYMSTQVAAWEAPTDEHEGMRARMQEQLDETFKFSLDRVFEVPPEKVSGEAFRESRMRELARRVLRDHKEIDMSQALVEQASAYAKEFKDSLEGWQDVEVPRRVLP